MYSFIALWIRLISLTLLAVILTAIVLFFGRKKFKKWEKLLCFSHLTFLKQYTYFEFFIAGSATHAMPAFSDGQAHCRLAMRTNAVAFGLYIFDSFRIEREESAKGCCQLQINLIFL
jgi:hypothetical protein